MREIVFVITANVALWTMIGGTVLWMTSLQGDEGRM